MHKKIDPSTFTNRVNIFKLPPKTLADSMSALDKSIVDPALAGIAAEIPIKKRRVPKTKVDAPKEENERVAVPMVDGQPDPASFQDHFIPPPVFGDDWHFLIHYHNFACSSSTAWFPGKDGWTTNWRHERLQ